MNGLRDVGLSIHHVDSYIVLEMLCATLFLARTLLSVAEYPPYQSTTCSQLTMNRTTSNFSYTAQ